MYPPRVIFEVDCSTRDTFKLNFNVSGCIDINKPSQDSDISFELMFPLIGAQTSSSTQWATELGCMGMSCVQLGTILLYHYTNLTFVHDVCL